MALSEARVRRNVDTLQHGKNGWGLGNRLKDVHGLYVPIAVATLIERVYVTPTAPSRVRDLLVSLVKRFGFQIPVLQSSLAHAPFYGSHWRPGQARRKRTDLLFHFSRRPRFSANAIFR